VKWTTRAFFSGATLERRDEEAWEIACIVIWKRVIRGHVISGHVPREFMMTGGQVISGHMTRGCTMIEGHEIVGHVVGGHLINPYMIGGNVTRATLGQSEDERQVGGGRQVWRRKGRSSISLLGTRPWRKFAIQILQKMQ